MGERNLRDGRALSRRSAVQKISINAGPLPFMKLTAQLLAEAIREAVTNQTMRMKATDLGRRLQAVDGPGQTIHGAF